MSSRPATVSAADPRFATGGAFVAGAFVPIDDAKISLLDWGLLRSDACQDTVSVWNGSFFRLEDHLSRFERNVGALRMRSPYGRAQLREIITDLVRLCGFRRAYVQMLMTRGRPPIGSRDPRQCENRFQVYCIPYVWIAAPDKQKTGLHLHVSDIWRIPKESVSPLIKHYHWLDFEMGLFEAYDAGAETVVLKDRHGNISEGPGFNVWAYYDRVLRTPDTSNVLDGLTRQSVLEIAAELDVETAVGPLSPAMLMHASEVFLSSTSGGILPITTIDRQSVGSGVPGPLTLRIHETYWAKRESGWHATPVTYPNGSRL